ncbi:MAG TPA: hypothetical protein VMV86_02065 [Methanosarcinales archaeon]|nr:hypothetical protein [Methanosarcinales archaeon]
MELTAPENYWKMPRNALMKCVNGCGPDGWKNIIPQHLTGGASIVECCYIHDWQYQFGINRKEADVLFRKNIQSVSRSSGSNWFFKKLHFVQSWIYYRSVRRGGKFAWVGGNDNSKLQTKRV